MEASVRYPELFVQPEERVPESFWISLRYFNFYRIALAALFLGTKVIGELRILMRLAAPARREAPKLTEDSFRSF